MSAPPGRLEVGSLVDADRARWEVLARGYKTFYKTSVSDADLERTWRRLRRADSTHALGARLDGHLVGIAHFLFHPAVWTDDVCYLQDLFVDGAARGQGVARALIEHVAEAAARRAAPRLYWLTAVDNAVARTLYDKVAQYRGFIRYDHPLD